MEITYSEPKDYVVRSVKGLIASLVIKTIRGSKKIKKARLSITNVSLKDIYNIIKKFEDFPYEGYVRKRSTHMPTYSYLYPSRDLSKCIMIFNIRVFPVRNQIINTQNMNNSEMITQNIPNPRVFYSDDSELKRINVDKRKSKRVIVNACYLDNIEF